jgi:2-dehydro-3-deoxyphosphogluconate aldolase / (4S)-4-hydroxy-2-oxoglutarate aldolase
MTAAETVDALCARRLVPVVVLERLDDALPLAQALCDGGLPIAEVTLRSTVAVDVIRVLTAETDLLVGAGTVIRPEQVDEAVGAGARFIVTPGFSARVVERCLQAGVPVIPGVATATEIIAALEYGLELLKFFPAEAAGGAPALRALQAPFPGIRFIPTGGLTAANAAGYLDLRSVAALGGSWMVAPELIASHDFAAVSTLAAEAVRIAAPPAP